MIEEAIQNILESNPGVSDLVDGKVYHFKAGESVTGQYVVYQILDSIPTHHLTGTAALKTDDLQVSCWATGQNGDFDAIKLKNKVIDCLNNHSGTDAEAGVIIQVIKLQSGQGNLADFSAGVDKSKHYGKRLKFRIWYKLTS